MDLAAVMDDVYNRLGTIAGLRRHAFPPGKITPPGAGGVAIVSYPETLTFDATYGRGSDHLKLPVVVAVGKVSDRAARNTLGAYCNGSGPKSIKAVLETGTYTAFGDLRVEDIEFDVIEIAGAPYMAALFTVDISGPGS